MTELKKEGHKFHLVIGRKLKKSLENLPEFDRGMGAADLIGRILSHFVPLMEKEHQRCEQQYSRYRFVSPDPEEKRDHINVDLPEKAYRFLKVMHQDMNFYSIGQIIRRYLVLFLRLTRVFGTKTFLVLQMIFNKWEEHDRKYQPPVREKLVQLKRILYQLPGRNRLLTLYKGDYTPLRVFRL